MCPALRSWVPLLLLLLLLLLYSLPLHTHCTHIKIGDLRRAVVYSSGRPIRSAQLLMLTEVCCSRVEGEKDTKHILVLIIKLFVAVHSSDFPASLLATPPGRWKMLPADTHDGLRTPQATAYR